MNLVIVSTLVLHLAATRGVAKIQQPKSGLWRGHYVQYGKNYPFEMKLMFDLEGKVTGGGTDRIGKFSFDGTWKHEGRSTKFIKQYIGKHSITYEATYNANGDFMSGLYSGSAHFEMKFVGSSKSKINGGWSEFSDWSQCSVTCGEGEQSRSRECNNPEPQHGGSDCQGNAQEIQTCDTETPCPVNGGWSEFSDWSQCSVTCGEGEQSRSRECNNPAPQHGGSDCQGNAKEMHTCETETPCPGAKQKGLLNKLQFRKQGKRPCKFNRLNTFFKPQFRQRKRRPFLSNPLKKTQSRKWKRRPSKFNPLKKNQFGKRKRRPCKFNPLNKPQYRKWKRGPVNSGWRQGRF